MGFSDLMGKAYDELSGIAGKVYDDSKEYLLSEKQAYEEYKNSKTEKPVANPGANVAEKATTNYTPFYVGGGILVVIILLLLVRK
jgi:hypothetical protein